MDTDIMDIVTWLQNKAASLNLQAKIHPELARREQDWVYLPVRIEGVMGAFERAERLQDLEDQWENENNDANRHLLLIPAAG